MGGRQQGPLHIFLYNQFISNLRSVKMRKVFPTFWLSLLISLNLSLKSAGVVSNFIIIWSKIIRYFPLQLKTGHSKLKNGKLVLLVNVRRISRKILHSQQNKLTINGLSVCVSLSPNIHLYWFFYSTFLKATYTSGYGCQISKFFDQFQLTIEVIDTYWLPHRRLVVVYRKDTVSSLLFRSTSIRTSPASVY